MYDKRSGAKDIIYYDLVINGTGMLRIPHFPEEFRSFKGELLHSAEWDSNADLRGKRVGVVGTGASAIQVVPAIVDQVETLTVFQRRAPYIMPKLQFEYPDVAKWAFDNVPGLRWAARAAIFWCQEFLYLGFRHNSIGAKVAEKVSALHRRSQLSEDPQLRKIMTPNYEFGCKRVLPSNEYYPALLNPHVQVISKKIAKVVDKTIVTDDGVITELDVCLLCVTLLKVFHFQDFLNV